MSERFRALAADYDGTLATEGVVPPAVLRSLTLLREHGFYIILVTGRELPDLRSVAPDLRLFDRVVSENGGIVFAPRTGRKKVLGAPPDAQFIRNLAERGVHPVSVGEVVIACKREDEHAIREVIRASRLAFEVVCNADSAMILPRGLDKMSGLRIALSELGLSPDEVVAVGNAENDRVFLDQCGFSVAVANAIPELKAKADLVTHSPRGEGVIDLAGLMVRTGGRLGIRTPDPFGVNEVL